MLRRARAYKSLNHTASHAFLSFTKVYCSFMSFIVAINVRHVRMMLTKSILEPKTDFRAIRMKIRRENVLSYYCATSALISYTLNDTRKRTQTYSDRQHLGRYACAQKRHCLSLINQIIMPYCQK